MLLESEQEVSLRTRVEIEAVKDAAVAQVFHDCFGHHRVVVPVVHHAGTCEEVEVFLAALVVEHAPLSAGEDHGSIAAVAAHVGFQSIEDGDIGHGVSLHQTARLQAFELCPGVR